MAGMSIRVLKNGPYEVSGASKLEDFEGGAYALAEDPVYLCRCGRSANRPFCDGTHKKAGFQAAECVRLTSGR
jgi:CDGSH-type Zn-finger protein